MALGKNCRSSSLKCSVSSGGGGGEEGFVRALGRKRIEIPDAEDSYSGPKTPLKKQRSQCFAFDFGFEGESSKLEALPREILIKILCGVDHKDLKQLFSVSKAIREATLIAKQLHFAYSTPTKIPAFRTKIDFSESNDELDEIEAPNAPRLHRALPSRKRLEEISVNLLDSLEEGIRRGLFMDEDDE
ncbi:putative F-box domain, leucine-rich repeat domain, L domain-containing protein [Rosa chinensis]|uniref:Putative F-box domain, leucine-rich repeat domain, L domain-containing protein n=1 Tax=Rosa chinensis TaxID=74649 RepID=A0A2P6RWT8_ROSCH|nr:F-box protein SKIP27 [Rosa chinensis]PRQ50897.1 putative F-box domain, leucine-rich repeat domain, L domain-containing protein [Rosa chinensis]